MKRAADAVYARVRDDGSFVPADAESSAVLRRKRIKRGALVRMIVSRPRDYQQWRRAHQLGTLIAQNIEAFERFQLDNGRVDSHGALKHLQHLSGVECEDSELDVPGLGKLIVRQPRSLAFDEMDEVQFQAAYAGFCAYLRKTWWPSLSDDQIAEMASLTGDSA
jgi:hypothetical protein